MFKGISTFESVVAFNEWLLSCLSSTPNKALSQLVTSVLVTGRLDHPNSFVPDGVGSSGPSTVPDTGRPASFLFWIQRNSHDGSLTPSDEITFGSNNAFFSAVHTDLVNL